MHPASTNERKTVVDLAVYKRERTKKHEEPHDDAQEALNEIARYLLMAVRVITSRRTNHS